MRVVRRSTRRHFRVFISQRCFREHKKKNMKQDRTQPDRQITAAFASESSPELADREALVPEQNAQVCLSQFLGLLLILSRPEEEANR